MFKSKSRTPVNESSMKMASIISTGTVITGNINSEGDIRIDGILKGNITCKAKVLIGPDGVVEGDITAQQGDILGRVQGKIKMSELLHLHGKATVEGDIHAAKLMIEPTVSFNGQCQMGANIVELNPEMASLASAVNE
ncbi:MAG: polymer-forming cytoskeletal protein [Bacteroidetes bacterium]|nr:polymer-forming cytoskeletal protein [Bacteroidota bacterium]